MPNQQPPEQDPFNRDYIINPSGHSEEVQAAGEKGFQLLRTFMTGTGTTIVFTWAAHSLARKFNLPIEAATTLGIGGVAGIAAVILDAKAQLGGRLSSRRRPDDTVDITITPEIRIN